MEQTLRPVVFGDGSGLRAVCFQPGLEDFGVIVAAHGLTFVSRLLGTAFDADQKHNFIDLQHKDCVEIRIPLAASSRSKSAWTAAALDAYLADPRGDIHGAKMFFKGLPESRDRADVIAYLTTLK